NDWQLVKKNVTRLEVVGQGLKGELDLSNFINLEYLDCSNNELTSLSVSDLAELKEINCSNNCLKSEKLNLSGLSNLETFSGKHNLFENLNPFTNLENLKHLELTDNDLHELDDKQEKQDLDLNIFK